MRADIYIAQKYQFSRHRVQDLIKSGFITVNGKVLTKASTPIQDSDQIEITQTPRIHWVSRSAQKLADFLAAHSDISVRNAVCLDVGSSTGGFTQVLLEQGATHVDAVDVWRDQLHESLRNDTRVSVYEETDIRAFMPPKCVVYDMIVCDASFISLTEILDAILAQASIKTNIILLFKPQFEVGREYITKSGVPKSQKVVDEAKKRFEHMIMQKNAIVITSTASTLCGEAGNQEYVYWIRKKES